ncbi:MAG: hypothetical protein JXA90_16250 [Planctomycetes bacterium]|nr:hypothetical protein [Planctomycetota bacterium]
MNGKASNRRRTKLVRVDLQLKVVFIILFVTSMVLLINFQLALVGLTSLSSQFGDSPQARAVVDAVRQTLIYKFLISVGLAVPIAASLGILYSFKFCGPIYRFKKYFMDMTAGRWDERCYLRKDDDLKDVAASINTGCDLLRSQIHSSHELLQEAKGFLSLQLQGLHPDEQREALEALLARVAEEESTYADRLGAPAAAEEGSPWARDAEEASGGEPVGAARAEAELEHQS